MCFKLSKWSSLKKLDLVSCKTHVYLNLPRVQAQKNWVNIAKLFFYGFWLLLSSYVRIFFFSLGLITIDLKKKRIIYMKYTTPSISKSIWSTRTVTGKEELAVSMKKTEKLQYLTISLTRTDPKEKSRQTIIFQ